MEGHCVLIGKSEGIPRAHVWLHNNESDLAWKTWGDNFMSAPAVQYCSLIDANIDFAAKENPITCSEFSVVV